MKIQLGIVNLAQFLSDFKEGKIQRFLFDKNEFTWEDDKKLELFENIKRGFPMGSLFLKYCDGKEEHNDLEAKSLGSYEIPKKHWSHFYEILDGFQRLSILIGCLLHPEKTKQKNIERDEEEWFKEFNIVYNLKDEVFEINQQNLKFFQVPVFKLIDAKAFFGFQRQLPEFESDNNKIEQYIRRYEDISLSIQRYEICRALVYNPSTEDIHYLLHGKKS